MEFTAEYLQFDQRPVLLLVAHVDLVDTGIRQRPLWLRGYPAVEMFPWQDRISVFPPLHGEWTLTARSWYFEVRQILLLLQKDLVSCCLRPHKLNECTNGRPF